MLGVRRCASIGASIGLLAGCAIKPIPTGSKIDTYEIVRTVRCEARAAVLKMRSQGLGGDADAMDPDAHRRPQLTRTQYIEEYGGIGLAYDFEFDISEANNLGGSVSLGGVWPFGTVTIGGGASYDRTRANKRTFRVTDNAAEIEETLREYCRGSEDRSNWAYPISGRLGLEESIGTFVQMNEHGNFTSEKAKVPQLIDEMLFTTKVSANVGPASKAGNGVRELRVVDASLKGTAERTDKHKLIFAVSLPDAPKAGAAAKSAGRKSSGERNADRAIDDYKNTKLFNTLQRIDDCGSDEDLRACLE